MMKSIMQMTVSGCLFLSIVGGICQNAFAGDESETDPVYIPTEVTGSFLTSTAARKLPRANYNVIKYAIFKRGRRVGNGQCAVLASEALKSAGARRTGPYGPNADYVWGSHIGTFRPGRVSRSNILPGDILQFRDARFEWRKGNRRYTRTANHHTAIVAAVRSSNRKLYVLHQNVGGNKTVQVGEYPMNALTKGWIKVYRPQSSSTPNRPIRQWVRYSIKNRTGRTVTLVMSPSGKSHTLKSGERRYYQSLKINGRSPSVRVSGTTNRMPVSSKSYSLYRKGFAGSYLLIPKFKTPTIKFPKPKF